MISQVDLYNQLVGEIVGQIVKPPIDAGGDMQDVLVLLEGVVAGVILFGVKMGGDERVLDVLIEGVKVRLARARLHDVSVSGQA